MFVILRLLLLKVFTIFFITHRRDCIMDTVVCIAGLLAGILNDTGKYYY